MPQPKQLFSVSFSKGIDSKTDPHQLQPGSLLDAANAIFTNTGSISKRWGYEALPKAILGSLQTIGACAAINTFQSELLAYDGLQALSYSSSNQAWVPRGGVVSVIQTDAQILRNNNEQLSPDFGTLSNVEVYAWEDSRGGIRYSVVDGLTGTKLLIDQPIYTAQANAANVRPKVLAFAAAQCILILFANAGTIGYVAINVANPTSINTNFQTIANSSLSETYYDAQVVGAQLFLSYYTASHVMLGAYNASFTGSPITVASISSAPVGCINVATDPSENIWVSYTRVLNGTDGYTSAYSYGLNSQLVSQAHVIHQATGPLQSLAGIYSTVEGAFVLYGEAQGSQTFNNVIYDNSVNLASTVGTQTVFARSVGLASKPFANGSSVYVNVAFQDNLQPTYFTLDASGEVIAKDSQAVGGGLIASSDFTLPECVQVSPGVFKYCNLVKGDPITTAGQLFQLLGVNCVKLDFADSNQFISSEISNCLYTVGGIVQVYDGSKYVEAGHHVYPNGITASAVSGSGGHIGSGTFQYVFTYEDSDANGDVLASTPSVPIEIDIASGTTNQLTLTIPTLRLTKKDNVRIVVYRNTPSIGGELLFQVSNPLVPIYNDPTVDSVQFTDTFSDASIQANGLCYTQPFTVGANPVLENAAPPACRFMTVYGDRIFLGGLGDGNTLWFSKTRELGSPMQFAVEDTLQVDASGGPITALGVLNSALIIFKQSAIFSLVGNGPDNTGSNSDFGSPGPQSVISTVGCVEPNSIVKTPMGLMFKSAQGIYLLDQSGNVSYKGAPVEKYNDLVITSATCVPDQWVIFTTSSGTALCYDYLYDQWATFTNHFAIDSALYLGGGNTFVFANPDGTVYQQSQTFSDAGKPISLSLTTGWINFSQLQGFQKIQRILLLGTYKGPHKLVVSLAYDYVEVFTGFTNIETDQVLGAGTYGSTGPYGIGTGFYGGTGQVYQFTIKPSVRKCQAVKIQIQDIQGAGPNEGYSISALQILCSIKTGTFKQGKGKVFSND